MLIFEIILQKFLKHTTVKYFFLLTFDWKEFLISRGVGCVGDFGNKTFKELCIYIALYTYSVQGLLIEK